MLNQNNKLQIKIDNLNNMDLRAILDKLPDKTINQIKNKIYENMMIIDPNNISLDQYIYLLNILDPKTQDTIKKLIVYSERAIQNSELTLTISQAVYEIYNKLMKTKSEISFIELHFNKMPNQTIIDSMIFFNFKYNEETDSWNIPVKQLKASPKAIYWLKLLTNAIKNKENLDNCMNHEQVIKLFDDLKKNDRIQPQQLNLKENLKQDLKQKQKQIESSKTSYNKDLCFICQKNGITSNKAFKFEDNSDSVRIGICFQCFTGNQDYKIPLNKKYLL